MSPDSCFFISSCLILIITIINWCVGPIINKRALVNYDSNDCSRYSDILDKYKETEPKEYDRTLKIYEYQVTRCKRGKAMYNM